MDQRKIARVGAAIGLFLAVNACGGGDTKPADAPVVVAAPPPPTAAPSADATPPPPVTSTRPASVALWVHVENVPSWISFFGVKADATSDSKLVKELGTAVTTFDFSRPLDAAFTFVSTDDYEGAAIIPLLDKEKFLSFVRESSDVTQRKSRFIITDKKAAASGDADSGAPAGDEPKKKKTPMDDKVIACDFVASPLQAICGTERGLEELAPWLRSSPKPEAGADLAFEIYAEPLRQKMLDGINKDSSTDKPDPNADPETARKKAEEDAKTKKSELAFVGELDRFGMAASIKDDKLALGMRIGFRGTESAWVKPIFAAPIDTGKNDLLFKLTENANAAVYSQGGGPLPELITSVDAWTDLAGAEHAKGVTLSAYYADIFRKPWGFAYGIDFPRVTKALANLKSAKDPDAAKKALASAIDGYAVAALTADIGTFEKNMREYQRLVDVENKIAAAKPSTTPREEKTKTTVRSAPASLGLPKGSFFLDETKLIAGKKPKDPKKKVTTTSGLCVSDSQYVYLILSLASDQLYVDAAKEVLARKGSPRAIDPMFQQKGIVFDGQVTSLVGAFGTHELALTDGSKLDAAARTKLVLDLEHDLAAPRLPLPFALTANRSGAGGVVAFDVKGDKAAFSTIITHAIEGAGAFLLLPILLAAAAMSN